ncbi:type VI secretion system Vgr family protein [Flavobacterium sp. ASV13]|uniref:type VI secretion system Vgr family protein n=1 Tax=Flavobacterium sp. ASV13 TaxID=1506583 RepID=UPI00054F5271|nr:phage baseplate assembly protein V [Flavobacterium sp. ASV13]
MAHFSDQVHITIGGFTQNIIYYDLKLSQKMADHHYFSFVWKYNAKAVIPAAEQDKAMKSYNGNEVIFTFKSLTGIKLMSKGIITGLTSIDRNGSPVGLHVNGTSHSIVIDGMPKCRTYLERGMDDIVLDLLSEGPTEFYQRDAIRSTYLKEFSYMAQYNESNFNFLKRLAQRYGQWFYFDGMRMQFGQIKNTKIKLINGASLHDFTIQTNMSAHKISLAGYDYSIAANIRNSSARTTSGSKDGLASNIGFNQGTVAQPDLTIGAYTNNAQSKDELEEMVALQTAASDANSVYYSGISYFPLGLGQMFTIIDENTERHLVCIEATHHSEVHGNYTCEFKAIPDDVSAPHYTDTKVFARAETQPAKIKDNNDPEGLGRVRVEFYWSSGSTSSKWIRMIQPHTGGGKGFYFIPEIGEEVLVGFEGGNAQCPYVMGAHYNGQAKSDFYDSKNRIKGWKLLFGQLFKFIEKVGIWLSDPSGNELHMNEETKSTTLTVPETLTLNCKNLIINASESIMTTAGTNILESAGENHTSKAGANMVQSANEDYLLTAKNITKLASDNYSTDAKDISRNASGKIQSFSEENHIQNSKGNINNHSGENSINS